jgi:hypothetical protein
MGHGEGRWIQVQTKGAAAGQKDVLRYQCSLYFTRFGIYKAGVTTDEIDNIEE